MIVAIWGDEKIWKSTFGLTFPKPIAHFDLDVGGFDRAIWRLSDEERKGISSKSYPTPIELEKLMGAQKDGITIKIPKKVMGIREVWQQIVVDYVAALRSNADTVIMDSATQLWSICHRGRLQELQEKQIAQKPNLDENLLREKLQPLEYAEPNSRMSSIIFAARSSNKNLILTHYPRDVYASRVTDKGIEEYRTGELEIDGFKHTSKLVDMVILMYKDKSSGAIGATVTRCGVPGLGTAAEGMEVLPSYEGIMALQDIIKGGK